MVALDSYDETRWMANLMSARGITPAPEKGCDRQNGRSQTTPPALTISSRPPDPACFPHTIPATIAPWTRNSITKNSTCPSTATTSLPCCRRWCWISTPHTWLSAHWRDVAWETDAAGGKYMVTIADYGIEALREDGRAVFPDRPYHAVCFGYPTPVADVRKTNDYSAEAGQQPGRFPLLLAGRGLEPIEEMERRIREQGFFGYKVLLPWLGDDYGSVTIEDMLGEAEMELANRLRLVVLLHVPRSRRLADPVVKAGVRKYAREYPDTQFVLAHCGRCYLPDEMAEAIGAVADLPKRLPGHLHGDGPHRPAGHAGRTSTPPRLLFATDFPVAAMRGRRVYAADHWVDLVLDGFGYPPQRLPRHHRRYARHLHGLRNHLRPPSRDGTRRPATRAAHRHLP